MTTIPASAAAAPPAPGQNAPRANASRYKRQTAPRHIAQARRPLLATAIAVALGTAPQVYAATEPGDTLDEVVVTANRREQNVLDVPYNISAVSGPALSNAGATNLPALPR